MRFSSAEQRGVIDEESTAFWTHSPAQRLKRFILLAVWMALLASIYPLLAKARYAGNADIHGTIESVGALFGLVAGFALITRFYSLSDRLYLFLGLAFFINGAEDFVHGFLSLASAHGWLSVPKATLASFIPGTYVTGRLLCGILLIFAPFSRRLLAHSRSPKRETFWASGVVLVLAVVMTSVAFVLPLPRFIYPERFISRPVDFVSALVLLAALMVFIRQYRRDGDIICWWILLSIGVNLVGQVIMSFSKLLFDAYFDIAHVYKLAGYVIPLLGFCLYQIRIIAEYTRVTKELTRHREHLGEIVEARTSELKKTNKELQQEIGQRKRAEEVMRASQEELQKTNHAMGERVKEITCLYGLSRLVERPGITLEGVFQGLVELIPPGWQYPQITAARLIFENHQFETADFRKTAWLQSADIKMHGRKAGSIEVCYLKEKPSMDEGPFLQEERNLLNALAEYLGRIVEREKAKEGLQTAKKAAEAANAAKSDFLANMSHEIRTPMTAILGYTDLLINPDLTPSDRDNHLAVIRRNGEHLLSLINNILDLSKIEAGRLTMESRPCSLLSIVADVASMMRVRADQRGTSLSTHYTNQLPETILTDGPRLRQTLLNLVGNAIKFTENGSVRIVVTFLPDWRDQKPGVQVKVIDTGIGISPEKLPNLFDPFVQADSSTSRKYGGSGLGLAIAHHIAELLAGELTAQSTPGVGSTFTLVIPTGSLEGVKMLDSPTEVVRELAAQGHGPQEKNLTGRCILLAEDGIDNQNLISHLLRKAGAHVEVADNGKIAVQKASDQPFDVILMDMQMPEMDGYEATRVLRERGFTGPILALTAHAMSSDREKCLQAGCDDYMAKPINPAKLVQTVVQYGGKETSTDQITTDPTQKPSSGATQPIESEFADDPDFTQIIDQFVAGLTDKVESMQHALASTDFETLQRLAHQLKGAGGNYGYPALTDPSKALEEAAKARDREAAGLAFTPLAKLCQAIVAARKAETPSDGA